MDLETLGLLMVLVGAIGFWLWARSYRTMLTRIYNRIPDTYQERILGAKGRPSFTAVVQLIYQEEGILAVVLALIFVLATQAMVGFGLVFLLIPT